MLLKSALLALLTIAAYWPAMHSDFVYDDAHFVFANEGVRHGGISITSQRALTLASYRLNFLTTGENPLYFHLTNLLIHLLNGILVFVLLREVFSFDETWSLFAAGVFLLHPLASEAVIYISGRSELLAMLFILLSVLFYSRSWRIPAFLAFFLAVVSKEIALVIPVLWWLTARKTNRPAWPLLACIGLGLWLSPVRAYLQIIRENLNISEFYGIVSLLGRAVLPIGLNVDHDFTAIPWSYGFLAASGFLLGLGTAFFYQHSNVGIAILWIGALTLPHVLVEPQGYFTEHHLYAPMFGIVILLTLAIRQLSQLSGGSHATA